MKREPLDMTGRPAKPWPVRAPDELEFVEQFRIKAATGVDVMDPPTYAHGMAACLWLESREWENPLTWEECGRVTSADLDLSDGDEELPPGTDEEADPTVGSGTPSNVSSSQPTRVYHPGPFDAAPPAS